MCPVFSALQRACPQKNLSFALSDPKMMRERANCKAKRRATAHERAKPAPLLEREPPPRRAFGAKSLEPPSVLLVIASDTRTYWSSIVEKKQESRHGTRSRSTTVADRRATSRNHFDCALLAPLGNVFVFTNYEIITRNSPGVIIYHL